MTTLQTRSYIGHNAPTWETLSGKKYYHRVFFDAPTQAQVSVQDANFSLGTGRGFAITSDGILTTDVKIAAIFIVDDTVSASWSDPIDPAIQASVRTREIPQMIQRLFERTQTMVDGSLYTPSYGDFWIFQNTEIERTSGFDSRLDVLQQCGSALVARGKNSNLFETSSIALSGVQPQSLIDAIIEEDDEFNNIARAQKIVNYLRRDSGRNLLRLVDVQAYYDALTVQTIVDGTTWDGNPATLATYPEARQFVLERWAKSFIPVGFIISDGDDSETGISATDVALAANSAWKDDGFPVHTFGLGTSHRVSGIRSISDATSGRHFLISSGANNGDWDNAVSSFLQGGDNSLFTAVWSNVFDYASPVWVRQVETTYSTPARDDVTGVNSDCIVRVRWSKNRQDFTPWMTLVSGTPVLINDEIVVLEYHVTMIDGWSSETNGVPLTPSVSVLRHLTVEPSRKYYISLPQNTNGLPVEYLLNATVELPRSARLSWGICRGDSRDFADFEPIHTSRIGMLSNRQYCLQYTDASTRVNLPTSMLDTSGLIYQVLNEDGLSLTNWATNDQVFVYGNGVQIVVTQYSLDNENGIINFLNSTFGATITVTINRPASLYNQVGESTSTLDGRTYFLSNGRVPKDSEIIVLINGSIVRGGWHISYEDGTITFDKERENTDIVTVFVVPSGVYRIGAELKNYDDSEVNLVNYSLFFSTVNNSSLLYKLNNTPSPIIKPNTLVLLPSIPTTYSRLYVDYQFISVDGNTEKNTQITWWRKRPGDVTVYALGLDEDGFVEITSDNNFHEYRDRVTQRRSDIGPGVGLFIQGDQVRVKVKPSDGYTIGAQYTSPAVTLLGTQAPYISPFIDVTIVSPDSTLDLGSGVTYVKSGNTLTATYLQVDPDNGPDQAVIQWYNKDSSSIASGKTIPQGVTTAGQIISFIVTPYDGQMFGVPVQSGYVSVR